MLAWILLISFVLVVALLVKVTRKNSSSSIPLSVNYHFTRECNYKCGFCFHTQTNTEVLPIEEAKKGLRMLAESGMKKINFSGGEPFINAGKFVCELAKFCATELKLDSVTIVSNGSLIREHHLKNYGKYIDILAISCDSFNEETNQRIGRGTGIKGGHHINQVYKIAEWCNMYNVVFKLNTVVNIHNYMEDMNSHIVELAPKRWKVFQCLPVTGENIGEEAIRNVEPFVITTEQFEMFIERHQPCRAVLVKESNEMMQSSYYILDEYMRFLDCSQGGKKPGPSILDVGVQQAMLTSGFDEKMFKKRGGIYKWSKKDQETTW